MKDDHRKAIRVAGQIQREVAKQQAKMRGGGASGVRDIGAALTRYLKLRQYAELACSRQWLVACRHISRQTDAALEDMNHRIREFRAHQPVHEQPVFSIGDIIRDLRAIEEEFGGWEIEPKEAVLSVRTESIELEGIELGPFEIQLNIRTLGRSDLLAAFEISALDPNSAMGNDAVTHPHVNDGRLCCGDGSQPIQAALRAGRIFDFFILVRSILQTYNPGSAYVSLDSWTGNPCYDCGDLMSDGESYYCDHCEHDFCDHCSSCCRKCESTSCEGCLDVCPECKEKACPSCRMQCSECGETFCNECLDNDVCPTCKQNKENDHEAIKQTDARPRVPASLAAG